MADVRRRRIVAGLASVLLVLLIGTRGPEPAGGRGSAPRPAAEAPVRRIPPPPGPVAAAPPAPRPDLPEIALSLELTDPSDWWPVARDAHPHAPWLYWPRLDEADWPDLPTTAAMDRVVECLLASCDELGQQAEAFVAAAEDDGLLPLPEEGGTGDPWTDVMAAQAAYASLFVGDDDEEAQLELVTARQRLAARVVEEDADPRAADLARLIVASGSSLLPPDDPARDEDRTLEDLVRVLDGATSPAMVAEAGVTLSIHPDGDAVLDRLEASLPRTGEHAPAVARGGLGLATRAGRWGDALRWAQALEELPDADDGDLDRVEWVRAAALAAGHGAADGWRVELLAAAWRCDRAHPLAAGAQEVLRWDIGAGAWRLVDGPAGIGGCMAAFQPAAPGPGDAIVTLRVWRP